MTEDRLLGTELGDLRIERKLGAGGFGAVYEAEDLALRRKIAVKVLLPELVEDAAARERFQREINHAVAIEHPHVVPVYNAGFEQAPGTGDRVFFIAMRLVPGPDLAAVLREDGPLPERRALRLLGQLASALHWCHDKDVVHRDVKPPNVLVWSPGTDEEHAWLTDFGIAKALDDPRSITGVGGIGTPAYMSPEVCLGNQVTAASDQYSLAVVAFELLSGTLPYTAEDGFAWRRAHVEDQPRDLCEVAPNVSAHVGKAVKRALSKDPRERFGDIREMVYAMRAEESFARSEALNRALNSKEAARDKVRSLSSEHGLSDDTISQLTDVSKTEVVRLRRAAARRALVGRR